MDAQTSHIDWLPTFCELAGCDVPTDRTIDGKSLASLLKAGVGTEHHEYVYHTWDRYVPNPDRRWSISDSRWKLMGLFGTNAAPDPRQWQLYDLKNDPGETKNVMRSHADTTRRLRTEFVRWFDDVTDGVEYAPILIPVGHPGENTVELSPSWATRQGDNINYTFDGYDWDTIDGWKEPGERATWKLDVQQSDSYRIQLSYGCRPLDAGGILRLRVGSTTIDHQVNATSTADQFAVFDAGMAVLQSGTTKLTIEVVSSPGRELMRLNSVFLERQD